MYHVIEAWSWELRTHWQVKQDERIIARCSTQADAANVCGALNAYAKDLQAALRVI